MFKHSSKRGRGSNKTAASRHSGFSIETLEHRRLMAADLYANSGVMMLAEPTEAPTVLVSASTVKSTSGGAASSPVASEGAPLAPAFDGSINVSFVTVYGNEVRLNVDGSDYNDAIQVQQVVTGINGFVRIRSLQYVGGSPIESVSNYYVPSGKTLTVHTPVMINGKGGNDTIENFTSAMMSARGGEGHDTLLGGSGADYLYGDQGFDIAYGRGGNDRLYGGDHDDYLYGGEGADYVYGQGGHDYLYGDLPYATSSDGWDWIYGGDGNDRIYAGGGDDTVYGENGHDWIYGGYGNDWMEGGAGDDWILGEDGSDVLYGNDGYDRLFGGDHDDYLNAGHKSGPSIDQPELMYGGQGADRFVRHRSITGRAIDDYFADYNPRERDWTENVWHW